VAPLVPGSGRRAALRKDLMHAFAHERCIAATPGACGHLAMYGAEVGVVAHVAPTVFELWRDRVFARRARQIEQLLTITCRTRLRMPGMLQWPAANSDGS